MNSNVLRPFGLFFRIDALCKYGKAIGPEGVIISRFRYFLSLYIDFLTQNFVFHNFDLKV